MQILLVMWLQAIVREGIKWRTKDGEHVAGLHSAAPELLRIALALQVVPYPLNPVRKPNPPRTSSVLSPKPFTQTQSAPWSEFVR